MKGKLDDATPLPEEQNGADPSPAGTGEGPPGPGIFACLRSRERIATSPAAPPANLYVLTVFLTGGSVSEKFANKVISRTIEIRGDQTLEQLHHANFEAFDRFDAHLYEFQLGKRPFDPEGPNYRIPNPHESKKGYGDAGATTLDALDLKPDRVFGYLFVFGDEWFHQIQVERVEQAIPTVIYPRVIKRVGKSPPLYLGE